MDSNATDGLVTERIKRRTEDGGRMRELPSSYILTPIS